MRCVTLAGSVPTERPLAPHDAISRRVEGDRRLHAWIPLDWARAYLLLGEIEAAVAEAREFYIRVTAMRSPHALRQARRFVRQAEQAGYGDALALRDFWELLASA